MRTNAAAVVEEVMFGEYPTGVVFFKNMAKHLLGIDTAFCLELRNVFLIRDPARLITSFAKVVPELDEAEIGLKHACSLFRELRDKGNDPLVLNSDLVLQNPRVVLGKLCAALGIPFDSAMLHWEPGSRPEDGSWAPYWYGGVHRSSGFGPPPTDPALVPERYKDLLEEVTLYFAYLNRFSISPDTHNAATIQS